MYTLTRERLEEIAICIVQCGLDEDEAVEYALSVAGESRADGHDVVDVDGVMIIGV